MGSSEEYLDSLLRAAMENEGIKQPNESEVKAESNDPNTLLTPEEIDPGKMLSPEEIEAMFASMEVEATEDTKAEETAFAEEVVAEPEPMMEESVAEPEPIIEEPVAEPEPIMEEPVAESEPAIEESIDPGKMLSPEEIEAMFASMEGEATEDTKAEETIFTEEPVAEPETIIEEPVAEELDLQAAIADLEEEEPQTDTDMTKDQMNAIFTAMEATARVDEENSESGEVTLEELMAEVGDKGEIASEIRALYAEDEPKESEMDDLAAVFGEDDELAQINELLSQSDSGSALDDDMLALLENMSEGGNSEYAEHLAGEEPDDIDIFAMEAFGEAEQALGEEEMDKLLAEKTSSDTKKPKKEKKKWFGKGKKKKNEETAQDLGAEQPAADLDEEMSGEDFLNLMGIEENENQEVKEIKEKEAKKQGFFGRLFETLTEEVEEEEEEEKPAKEKKKKEKKGKKAGKEPASEENEALLEELEEEDKKDKKKKKAKKVKKQPKEKPPKEATIEDGKKLPRKMVIRIFVMCFSIMLLLIVPAMMMPGLLLTKDAKEAYYSGDYKTAYENLNGRKLGSSDELMLEKATTLMKLQRKYESFANYRQMGKDLEALNALLEGCSLYEELKVTASEQNVLDELDAILENILYNLEYMYGVTSDKAAWLNSLEDDLVYTQELKNIVGNEEDVITGDSVPAYRVDE